VDGVRREFFPSGRLLNDEVRDPALSGFVRVEIALQINSPAA
jgi:hypothetical protein